MTVAIGEYTVDEEKQCLAVVNEKVWCVDIPLIVIINNNRKAV